MMRVYLRNDFGQWQWETGKNETKRGKAMSGYNLQLVSLCDGPGAIMPEPLRE